MRIKFSKYHGAGNDFIMIDNREDDRRIWNALTPETIQVMCERHFGIGADGVILAVKSNDPDTPYSMGYFNADGTPAEMCGNGLRCLVRFLDHLGEPVREMDQFNILTGAGPIKCRIIPDQTIQVEMPVPSFDPRDAKIDADYDAIPMTITVPGIPDELYGTPVGVGNPHFVLYNNEMWEGDLIHELGSRIAIYEDIFPEGVNVGFARKEAPDTIALVVWERGVGPTLACGSGAIAAVGAGVAQDKFPFDEKIAVRMPGGTVFVTIHDGWSKAVMEGDAVHVFDGEFDTEEQ
ncbi:diaminopimelate epimerase [bacterium]|nr:diaminopimelate epimerase [bacterium]